MFNLKSYPFNLERGICRQDRCSRNVLHNKVIIENVRLFTQLV